MLFLYVNRLAAHSVIWVLVFLKLCTVPLAGARSAGCSSALMSAPNLPVRSTLNTSNMLRGPEARPLTASPSSRSPCPGGCPAYLAPRQLNLRSNLIWQSQAWCEAGWDVTKMTFLAICSRELSFNKEPPRARHKSFCSLLMSYWFETMRYQIFPRLAVWQQGQVAVQWCTAQASLYADRLSTQASGSLYFNIQLLDFPLSLSFSVSSHFADAKHVIILFASSPLASAVILPGFQWTCQ